MSERQGNSVYRWVRDYVDRLHAGVFSELTLDTLDIVIEEWNVLFKQGRFRNSKNLGRKMSELHVFMKKILPNVLADLDSKGFSISSRVKRDTYIDIVENPENYVDFWREEEPMPDFDANQIPLSIRVNYKDNRFLATVYPTSNIHICFTIPDFIMVYASLKK